MMKMETTKTTTTTTTTTPMTITVPPSTVFLAFVFYHICPTMDRVVFSLAVVSKRSSAKARENE